VYSSKSVALSRKQGSSGGKLNSAVTGNSVAVRRRTVAEEPVGRTGSSIPLQQLFVTVDEAQGPLPDAASGITVRDGPAVSMTVHANNMVVPEPTLRTSSPVSPTDSTASDQRLPSELQPLVASSAHVTTTSNRSASDGATADTAVTPAPGGLLKRTSSAPSLEDIQNRDHRMSQASDGAAPSPLNAETQRYLPQRYSVASVLGFLPRMIADSLVVSCGFLLVVAVRVNLGYPQCGLKPEDMDFMVIQENNCSTYEKNGRSIESSFSTFVSR